jgi:hypothetical protein
LETRLLELLLSLTPGPSPEIGKMISGEGPGVRLSSCLPEVIIRRQHEKHFNRHLGLHPHRGNRQLWPTNRVGHRD